MIGGMWRVLCDGSNVESCVMVGVQRVLCDGRYVESVVLIVLCDGRCA